MQTHPLTDDICERIADTEDRPFTSIEKDNMRAAYDKGREDQLNECLDWLDKQDEHLFGYRDLMWKGLRGPKEPVPLRLQISDCFHSEDWKLMSKLANQLHKIEQQEDN